MYAKCDVTFIGGPFDGHCQPVSLSASELLPVAMLPVKRSTFRLLDGQATHLDDPVTSVAVYQLDLSDELCRYQFVRSLDPEAAQTGA